MVGLNSCSHCLSGWEHKAHAVAHLIEVKSLSSLSVPISPHPPDLSPGMLPSYLKRVMSGQYSNVPEHRAENREIQGGKGDERGYGVAVTGELMALRRKGTGMKAQAVISLYSLQRENVLKWGTDARSKWVDLKPWGHCPLSCGCVCVIASTPTLIDSLCCLIMIWVFFPGTEKLPYQHAWLPAVICGGRNMSRNMELKWSQMTVTPCVEIPKSVCSHVLCSTFLTHLFIRPLLLQCILDCTCKTYNVLYGINKVYLSLGLIIT